MFGLLGFSGRVSVWRLGSNINVRVSVRCFWCWVFECSAYS